VKMMNRRKFGATPRKCQTCISTECFAKAGWETFTHSAVMQILCSICSYLSDLHR
jgi:hypothetical protein